MPNLQEFLNGRYCVVHNFIFYVLWFYYSFLCKRILHPLFILLSCGNSFSVVYLTRLHLSCLQPRQANSDSPSNIQQDIIFAWIVMI